MPYANVVGLTRFEIYEEHLGLAEQFVLPGQTRYFYIVMTPVDADGNYVDIAPELAELTNGIGVSSTINVVNYFTGEPDATSSVKKVAYNYESYNHQSNNILYIYCSMNFGSGVSPDANVTRCIAPSFTLLDKTVIWATIHSGSGFDSPVTLTKIKL
jgi:hypothetical protein